MGRCGHVAQETYIAWPAGHDIAARAPGCCSSRVVDIDSVAFAGVASHKLLLGMVLLKQVANAAVTTDV
jgi:hypothetical protein